MNRAATVLSTLRAADWIRRTGQVIRFAGLSVESRGPDAHLGEICEIRARASGAVIPAEVVGLADGRVLLMPYDDLQGVEVGSEVTATGQRAQVLVGPHLLGRVIDGTGAALDGKPLPPTGTARLLFPPPLNPLGRGVACDVLETGIRAIDTLLTLARGQRIGIFAGSGVGKSTLLGMLARQVTADVSVVALVGERGREVKAFVENGLSPSARERTIVVAATSDQPPLIRRRAAFLATAVAEYFSEQGLHVCLTLDSLTRVAMAQREIGLASGELPTARGYTPSVFSLLPRLLERGGVRERVGSMTALYTVLVEGDDLDEPISDSVRAILDGHIVLSRAVAQRGRYPAIDVLQSISRLASSAASTSEHQCATEALQHLALYEASRDLIDVGAYRTGTNPSLDRAVQLIPQLEPFLAQGPHDVVTRAAAFGRLRQILDTKAAEASTPNAASSNVINLNATKGRDSAPIRKG